MERPVATSTAEQHGRRVQRGKMAGQAPHMVFCLRVFSASWRPERGLETAARARVPSRAASPKREETPSCAQGVPTYYILITTCRR